MNTALEVPPLTSYVSSCAALKQAVATLYNMGDFDLDKIGEGFFSEVFKVSVLSKNQTEVGFTFVSFPQC